MMTHDGREAARVRNPLLIVSAVTWVSPAGRPGGVAMSTHDPAAHRRTRCWRSARLAGGGLGADAGRDDVAGADCAGRPPTPAQLRHRRVRAITLFVSAYAAIWIAVGAALVAAALAASLLAPRSYLPAAAAALIALVWQWSPIKQRCLNRCHAHPELAAFGVAADIDALGFGHTRDLVCRFLLGVDAGPAAGPLRPPRRDGCRGCRDFQRTARRSAAAVLARARRRQSDAHRAGAGEDAAAVAGRYRFPGTIPNLMRLSAVATIASSRERGRHPEHALGLRTGRAARVVEQRDQRLQVGGCRRILNRL